LLEFFNTIGFDEDEPPVLSFAEEKLIMIEAEGTVWALVPLTDLENED